MLVFFRFSELCALRDCDIKLFPTYMSIFLESSKTDQLRDGAWIAIARSDRETCPVKGLERYIAAADIDLSEDLPLFRALSSPRSSTKVRCHGLSYTRAREIIKDAFRGITDISSLSLFTVLEPEEPLLPQMLALLIDSSRGTVVGRVRMLKMVMSRTIFNRYFQCPSL